MKIILIRHGEAKISKEADNRIDKRLRERSLGDFNGKYAAILHY